MGRGRRGGWGRAPEESPECSGLVTVLGEPKRLARQRPVGVGLRVGERIEVCRNSGDVATGDRAGERVGRTDVADRLGRLPNEGEEVVDRQAGGGRHALEMAEKGDDVVRGHDGGGVVGGTVGVVDGKRGGTECCGHVGDMVVTGNGAPAPRQALTSELRRGDGNERM